MSNQAQPLYLSFAGLKSAVIAESLKLPFKNKFIIGWYWDGLVSSYVIQPIDYYQSALEFTKKLTPPLWVIVGNGYVLAESPITPDTLDSWVRSVTQEYQKQIDSLENQIEIMREYGVTPRGNHATPPID